MKEVQYKLEIKKILILTIDKIGYFAQTREMKILITFEQQKEEINNNKRYSICLRFQETRPRKPKWPVGDGGVQITTRLILFTM